MCLEIFEILMCCLVVCAAFEDVHSQVPQEMMERGRRQYQFLQERGNLPRYGSCWKSAVEHVEESCRQLSEETQSDVALHITNCFLEMSGDVTYNCKSAENRSIRAICIRSMTDRAYNVYTEFYTHIQNICWFLRGQVWIETIRENTYRLGKQLEFSVTKQEEILNSQRDSLASQEKLLQYGRNLEKNMKDFFLLTKQHQDILRIVSGNLKNLQLWLVGEVWWVEFVVFYVAAAILLMVFTSANRTAGARLPICFLLIVIAITEHMICDIFVSNTSSTEIHLIKNDLYWHIWNLRYLFIILTICILLYTACCYKDLTYANNALLHKIDYQNSKIEETLNKIKKDHEACISRNGSSSGHISFLGESDSFKKPLEEDLDEPTTDKHNIRSNKLNNVKQKISPCLDLQNNGGYNLRSKRHRISL